MAEPTREATERDLFQQMLDVVWETTRSVADQVEPVGPGWIVRTPSLPFVWSLNHLRLVQPVGVAETTELVDPRFGDLGFRHVVLEADLVDRDLEIAFAAAGWATDREVYMALTDPPPPTNPSTIVELSEQDSLRLIRSWEQEEHPDITAEALDQLAEYSRREGRVWAERRFGVVAEDGTPLALTKLRVRASTAWVEDVYTIPAARRQGHARRLVTHAAALGSAGRDLTFIIADDNDWPKELYARLGFHAVGRTRTFHRDLAHPR